MGRQQHASAHFNVFSGEAAAAPQRAAAPAALAQRAPAAPPRHHQPQVVVMAAAPARAPEPEPRPAATPKPAAAPTIAVAATPAPASAAATPLRSSALRELQLAPATPATPMENIQPSTQPRGREPAAVGGCGDGHWDPKRGAKFVPPPAEHPAHPAVMPFAVDDAETRQRRAKVAPLEQQVMALSLERDRLDAEYSRMALGSGRSAAERRRKQEAETRLNELGAQINGLRKALRTSVA